jgi:2-methylcitrate dehydratase PrpD
MTGYFLDELARFCAETTYEALPEQTVHQAKRALLDLLGCALGGIRMGCNRGVTEYVERLGGRPEARIWSTGARVPAPHAALANGATAHHLELDDGHLEAASHPGISVIPAALATAEVAGAMGQDLILSIVLGYEVCIRAGLATGPGIREHGLHGPGLMGPLGAAAAASRLLGLGERQIGAALATAGCLLPVAPYESFVEGTPSKDLYAGWAGFSGILAAELAHRGMDGPHRFLEGKRSVGTLLLHGSVQETSALLHGLGSDYLIENIYFKPFAASRAVQPAVTGTLRLKSEHGFTAEVVESVHVQTYPFSAELSADSSLDTPVSARLSIPHAVAMAMLTDGLWPEAFLPEALGDETVLALASRVTVASADRYGKASTGARSSVVTVALSDGRVLTTEVAQSKWDRHIPPSDAELSEKFHRLAGGGAVSERVAALESAVWRLEQLSDVRVLVDMVCEMGELV